MAQGDVIVRGDSGRELAVVEVPTADGGVAYVEGVVLLSPTTGAATSPPAGGVVEDAVAAANPTGTVPVGVAITTLANEVPDGDYVAARYSRKGERFVKDTDVAAALTTLGGYLDGLEGFSDGLETLITAQAGYLDGVEALLGAATPAGENHIGQVGSAIDTITVSLTTATNAHTAGDVVAATQEIANCVRVNDGRAMLQSLVVIDTDDQGAALDLVFFSANTSLGDEEAAPDIDDTEVLTVLGLVSVAAADYKDLGGSKVATVKGIGLVLEAATGTRSLYVAAMTSGTPTYASGVVTLRLSVLQG